MSFIHIHFAQVEVYHHSKLNEYINKIFITFESVLLCV